MSEAENSDRRLHIAKKTRGTDRSSATKICNTVEASYKKLTAENFSEASLALKRLISVQTDLTVADSEIHMLLPDTELDKDIDKSNEYREKIQIAIATLELSIQSYTELTNRALADDARPMASGAAAGGSKNFGPKLPRTQLQNFEGDPLKWEEFWDDFESSVDRRDDITTSDKFKLLRQVLKGEARRVANGYTLTNANYDKVKHELKDRYGDPQVVVFAHFEKLISLQPADHNMADLRRVHDECESHINSLVGLGLTEETFGQVFVPIVLSKFPKFVKMELFRRNGSNKWTLPSLRSLLKDEIRARDMSEKTDNKNSGSKNSSSSRAGTRGFSGGAFLINGRKNQDPESKKPGRRPCAFCSADHPSWKCPRYPDFESRNRQVGDKCKACLEPGHFIKNCPKRRPCFYCKRDSHHSSLCIKQFGTNGTTSGPGAASGPKAGFTPGTAPPNSFPRFGSTSTAQPNHQQNQHAATFDPNSPPFVPGGGESSNIASAVIKDRGNALIKLGRGTFVGPHGPITAQFFFDDGSTLSFASSPFIRKLQAAPVSTASADVGRFGDSVRHPGQYLVYQLTLQLPNGSQKQIVVNEISSISPPVNVIPISLRQNLHYNGLKMAQPLVSKPTPVDIDILIGLDQYYDFIGPEYCRFVDGVVLHESILGYIASGYLRGSTDHPASIANQHLQLLLVDPSDSTESGDTELGLTLRKYFDAEHACLQTKKPLPDDELAQTHFDETVRVVNGRYEVKWPYRFENPDLADTYGIALTRLRGLLRRGIQNPGIISEYQKTFSNQISRGIIEVAPEQPQGLVYYVPHHVVIKPDKVTTKFRIVYDASAKPSKDSLSLNDALLRGPVIMSDLVGCILRFRQSKIGLISDVEKAFHMVGLAPEDRDVTRFLWVRDLNKPLSSDNLICYRFARVPFGTVASSFLLAATIVHHLRINDSPNSRLMLENCYVDNIVVGKPTLDDALAYYSEAKHLLSSASMNLREWFSNSGEFLKNIPEPDRGVLSTTSVLGISWDTSSDTFSCNLGKSGFNSVKTKREVLSALAALFDPCGSFAPVSVVSRLLMQELWKDGYGWDDVLPTSLQSQWDSIQNSLSIVPSCKIPRFLGLSLGYKDLQLHIFADASSKAYAAVSYLRVESSSQVTVSQLCAKARIAPIKTVTIPRLELMALVIASQLASFLKTELRLPISAWYLWSDSKCALYWVIREGKRPIFVANRVKEIHQVSGLTFRYVPSDSNPADVASRGASADSLLNFPLWWSGPSWLYQDSSKWPEMDVNSLSATGADVESPQMKVPPSTHMVIQAEPTAFLFDLNNISTLGRVQRITAYVMRFAAILRGRSTARSTAVGADELSSALTYWIQSIQTSEFGHLHAFSFANRKTDFERKLRVFKDPAGILRSRGRIEHGDVPETARNPILIPSGHRFTFLVIKDVHESMFHAGPKHTLAKLREIYWVVRGRSDVKSVIRECRLCRILLGGPYSQPKAPDLPEFRVDAIRPFDKVGVDYLGPILVQEGTQKVKFWVCLFTCAATRAIHLESISTLSASGFLQCLRRFVAVRDAPSLIVSDNAKQFRAADQVFQRLWKAVVIDNDIMNYSSEKKINWKFIPEHGPWFGGFYERLVSPVKKALHGAMHNRCVSGGEFQTLCLEIAAVLNTRPLVYSENVPGDKALTPCDLMGCKGSQFPEFVIEQNDPTYHEAEDKPQQLVAAWNRRQKILSSFWNQWRSHYLLSLREMSHRNKQRNTSVLQPEIGQVVIVKDSLPRGSWRLGRVAKLNLSGDGQCRSANVVLPNMKTICRPVKLLFPVESSVVGAGSLPGQSNTRRDETNAERPRRVAAAKARQRIAEIAAEEQQ